MNDEPTLPHGKATLALRERFLKALEVDDYAALRILSVDLRNCTDVLPRSVCVLLGLARGSTYASAAMTIVVS
jgi:hypothetical protein